MLRAVYLILTVAIIVGWVVYCMGPLAYEEPLAELQLLNLSFKSRPGLVGVLPWHPISRTDYVRVFIGVGILMTVMVAAMSLWLIRQRRQWIHVMQLFGYALAMSMLLSALLAIVLELIPVTHPQTKSPDRLWRVVAFTAEEWTILGGTTFWYSPRSDWLYAIWFILFVICIFAGMWWARRRKPVLWEVYNAQRLSITGLSLVILSLCGLLWSGMSINAWSENGFYTGFMLGWMTAICGFGAGSVCIIFNRRYCALYNVCHQCHYNLTGSVSSNCPECGAAK